MPAWMAADAAWLTVVYKIDRSPPTSVLGTSHTTSPERERERESERGRGEGRQGGGVEGERKREHACVVIQHIYTTNNNVLKVITLHSK